MSLISGCTAYDLILVHNESNTNDHKIYDASTAQPPLPPTSSSIAASECIFRFGTQYSSSGGSSFSTGSSYAVYLVVHDGNTGDTLRFSISAYNTIQQDPLFGLDTSSTPTVNNNDHRNSLEKQDQKQRQHDPVALQQLMDALTGANTTGTSTDNPCGPYKANFMLMSTNKNKNDSSADSANATTTKETLLGIAPFRIFIYPCHTTKLGIVDVDGTITTSTLSGFWNTAVLQDYSTRHCHAGVCPFLTQLVTTSTSTSAVEPSTTTGSIQLIYLTNRPITYVDATRNLLNELQEDCYTLPKGPLIGFTGNLAGVFKVCRGKRTLKSRRSTCSLTHTPS
jgi:LNS2 (Lipin/Ned1/Smp2)